MNPVFGTSVHADPSGAYAFFRVEGHINDEGRFMRINQSAARRQFPNRGTIRTFRLPPSARYGTFKLELDSRFERQSGDHNATKYRGLPTATSLYQTLQMSERSDAAELVGNKLRNGVKILAEIITNPPIFILFSDHVLSGPITMKALSDRPDVFAMDQQEWARPKTAWRNITASDLQYIDVPRCGETMFAAFPFREPDTYLDFAATEFSLRKVLETIRQSDGAAKLLSPADLRDLSVTLAKINPSPDLRLRIEALGNRLSTLEASNSFPELLQRCLALPAVRRQIEKEATQAKKVALNEISDKQREADEALKTKKIEAENVSSEISTLSERKILLEQEAQKIQTNIESSRSTFADAVAQAARNAEKDAIAFLAQVAVFRPFLGEQKSQTERITTNFSVQRYSNDAAAILDAADAVKRLSDMLKLAGVDSRNAFNASVEIVSALYIGQAVAFRGSLSYAAATIAAQTLSGRAFAVVEIPVGTRRQLKMQDFCADTPPRAILLNGANRSCIDAFGGELVDAIRLRLAGILKRSTPPYVFFSLREGPSTLSPTPQITELAPILHTDLWNWGPHSKSAQFHFSQLEAEYAPPDAIDSADLFDEVRAVYKDLPSATFSLCARVLLPVLTKFYLQLHPSKDTAREAALHSLVSSWLLPFLISHNASEDQIDTCLRLTKTDDEIERHVNLLKASKEC